MTRYLYSLKFIYIILAFEYIIHRKKSFDRRGFEKKKDNNRRRRKMNRHHVNYYRMRRARTRRYFTVVRGSRTRGWEPRNIHEHKFYRPVDILTLLLAARGPCERGPSARVGATLRRKAEQRRSFYAKTTFCLVRACVRSSHSPP